MSARVAVVGAGIAGAACARALVSAGLDVELIERGRAPGGRMATPSLAGRRTDLGAGYFTAEDDEFVAVVDTWLDRGIARPWTDTFTVLETRKKPRTTTGPTRYAAAGGLRALVRRLLPFAPALGDEVRSVADLDHDAVVLAMPDPQARRLTDVAIDWIDYESAISVALAWPQRLWQPFDAAFVNGDPDITLIADDGTRRADLAPVLVAHTTHDLARAHLQDPDAVVPRVQATVQRLLKIDDDPDWTRAHRWTFAKPTGTHGDEPFGLVTDDGRPLGLCTDSWCPSGSPRVESAWLSGHRLGRALAERL